MDTPYALVSLNETASTQDDARIRFDGNPVLVVAQRQTSGRGRGGSTWETAPLALAASLAFFPEWSPETWGRIPLVAGLSAIGALPGRLALKWPNDLVRDDRKVAGILVEASGNVVIAGIGINLWWDRPPAGYGSVFDFEPESEARLTIANAWATGLISRLNRDPEHWGRSEYRKSCVTLNKPIRWQPEGAGIARDVDHDGALLVETSAGIDRLLAEAVFEIRDDISDFDAGA